MADEAKYAFRCKNCGHLEQAGHAGEGIVPRGCRVCGAGVVWRHHELAEQIAAAIKSGAPYDRPLDDLRRLRVGEHRHDPANWEVLADATPARLAELGLAAWQVERHMPAPEGDSPGRPPQHLAVTAADGAGSADSAQVH